METKRNTWSFGRTTPGTIRLQGFSAGSKTFVSRFQSIPWNQEAYEKLRDAFKYMMGSSYPAAPAHQILDTCYYINNRTNVQYPFVSFTFSGGVEVQLHPSGIIYPVNSRVACFAFVGNTDPRRHSVFGNIQQKTLEIVYDLAGERLGFGQGDANE
ncbi:hypothetical protein CASFOL_036344 [Castilleja foliolosa]|uniref:Peptidase A1 domain-containing protein n=1 Tax=Castilleja foliolosa TaxID=1961234 RepID=A0ABD3BVZ5_9LAMI